MANKQHILKPAAYAVINTAVFVVCAFTFYQIGKHRATTKDTSAVRHTECSAGSSELLDELEKSSNTTAPPTTSQTTVESTMAVNLESWENQWHYWDVPWASAYQQLLWTGDYQADFLKNAAYLHTNGYILDGNDAYRNMEDDIDIYAALIYLDDDDTPELALTSSYHTTIYTYSDDALQLVASIDTLSDMHYYSKKLWLGDHFYKCMGGNSYAEIYDFSGQGLKSGTEQIVRWDFPDSDAETYSLYPDAYEYQFGGDWHEIKNGACLVLSFSPDDVITQLYNDLMK